MGTGTRETSGLDEREANVPIAALEIKDTALSLCTADGVIHHSPGMALVENGRLIVGTTARERSRHVPRHTHTHFWERLGTDPLAYTGQQARTQADLAYAHLAELSARLPPGISEVLLVVPASLNTSQLGLLLGICNALELPVAGMVDAAVAAGAQQPAVDGVQIHLALHLHQTVATLVSAGESAALSRAETLRGVGLWALEEALATRIANRFVELTRFDPMRHPETEQALFDRIPHWLAHLAHQETVDVEMDSGSRIHTLTFGRRDVDDLLREPLTRLRDWVRGLPSAGATPDVLICAEFSRFPGISDTLNTLLRPRSLTALTPDAPGQGALEHAGLVRMPEGNRRLVTRLPRSETPGAPSPEAAPDRVLQPGAQPASHVVYRGIAFPLNTDPLVVGREPPREGRTIRVTGEHIGISRIHCELVLERDQAWVRDLSTFGTTRNGDPIHGRATLHPGDVLELGGPHQTLHCITLAEPHETA